MKPKRSVPGYSQLKTKLLLQMLGILLGAVLSIFLLYVLVWAGRGANFMVAMFQMLLEMNYDRALYVYHNFIRNYAEVYIFLAIMLAFLGYVYFFISRFTRYFNNISRGIDALVKEGNQEIKLLPELQTLEKNLNTVRNNLKDQAQKAQLAEQKKNDLVMYLAHDIRTPLTSVIGYLSLLDELPEMPLEQRAKYVNITLEKALRLEQLVNEFFEITRYNLQQMVLEKEPIDLNYMLAQLLDEFYPMLAAKHNTLRLETNQELTIVADPNKLARVFNNLLKNAATYSHPDAEIVVQAAEQAGVITLVFQNSGPEIAPEKLATIFDKFYRLDISRTSQTGGAGLGLAIAKDIVEAHGGAISAHSENGQVAFRVSLPCQGPS